MCVCFCVRVYNKRDIECGCMERESKMDMENKMERERERERETNRDGSREAVNRINGKLPKAF